MVDFKNALNETLEEMLDNNNGLCVAVYWDDLCTDNAIIMFMEYGKHACMHACMLELHEILSKKLGYPVCVCHNHPTDEDVLVLGGEQDSATYHADKCCKEDTINCALQFLRTRTGYRPEIQAIALAAEAYADMCGTTAEEILNRLDYDRDPQSQLLTMFAKAHIDSCN